MKAPDIGWLEVHGRVKIDKNDLLLALYYAQENKWSLEQFIEAARQIGGAE